MPRRATRRPLRILGLALVAAALLALAGCKVDSTVTVSVHADGSGAVALHVVLDADAVAAAEADGGKLEERVRLYYMNRQS